MPRCRYDVEDINLLPDIFIENKTNCLKRTMAEQEESIGNHR